MLNNSSFEATILQMKLPAKPANEAERLADLHDQSILDTANDPDFDMLVELASRICETPISTLTLIDSDRQWFKAKMGVEVEETERSISFCAHAILQNDLLVVNDATKDHRFSGNPLVKEDPSIRFYAGAQIVSSNGHKLGTLCVIDTRPRELNWHQASALRILSNQASRLLELKRLKKEKKEKPASLPADLTPFIALFVDQLQSSSAVLERSLDPLKTGKFTKKQLSVSYAEAATILRRNERLARGLKLLGTMENPEAVRPQEDIAFVPLFKSIDAELDEELKKKGTRSVLAASAELTIRQYLPFIHDVIKGLLYFIYSRTNEEVSVSAIERDKSIELRFSLLYTDLVEALRRHDNQAVFLQAIEGGATAGESVAYDFFLLLIILRKSGGSWDLSRFGQVGTQVVLQFPLGA